MANVAPEGDRIAMTDAHDDPQERELSPIQTAVVPVAVSNGVQARDFAARSVTDSSEVGLADDEAGVPSEYDLVPAAVVPVAVTAAAVPVGIAAATAVRKPRKLAKGSRVVETLPSVDENGLAGLRRSIPPPSKGNYLLTPSIAPSVADPLDAGRSRVAPSHKGDWLTKDLSPQQTHYFLRELSTRELRWELDRAWLLTSFEKPQRQTRRVRRDFSEVEDDSRINDFDESSDEDLLDMDEDEDEEAVFRRGPAQQFGGLYNQPTIPNLPLLRFLFKNAFCTFPLFVAPEDKANQYVGGPPDKATLARTYFFTGLLPLLRAVQTRSLSEWVDRHGEGDGTPFSAVSTTGSVRQLLTKWAARYITAVLRVGPGDPYFEDEEALGKESWPWPASNLLPLKPTMPSASLWTASSTEDTKLMSSASADTALPSETISSACAVPTHRINSSFATTTTLKSSDATFPRISTRTPLSSLCLAPVAELTKVKATWKRVVHTALCVQRTSTLLVLDRGLSCTSRRIGAIAAAAPRGAICVEADAMEEDDTALECMRADLFFVGMDSLRLTARRSKILLTSTWTMISSPKPPCSPDEELHVVTLRPSRACRCSIGARARCAA